MDIEEEIFKRSTILIDTLNSYGFQKEEDHYVLSKKIMDGTFQAVITVSPQGEISGKVIDLSFGEEYTNYRREQQLGEFAANVREAYTNLLIDIKKNCATNHFFVSNQTNRLSSWILDYYHDEPDFPWENDMRDGVFRNPKNGKWYALIMEIDRQKIGDGSGKVEIVNLKLEEDKIPALLTKKGFYKAYHMNKEKWITIVLDDTLSDEEIKTYIQESHQFTEQREEWIVPANPLYYDVIHCFDHQDTINWKQSSHMEVGDIVYLYVGSPYSAILYRCEVLAVDVPYSYQDNHLTISKVMQLKLLKRYSKEEFPFLKLKTYGVTSIRGPRRMPKRLSKEMNQ